MLNELKRFIYNMISKISKKKEKNCQLFNIILNQIPIDSIIVKKKYEKPKSCMIKSFKFLLLDKLKSMNLYN